MRSQDAGSTGNARQRHRRSEMDHELGRLAALLASAVLIAVACTSRHHQRVAGGTVRQRRPPPSRRRPPTPRPDSAEPSATPVPTPLPANDSPGQARRHPRSAGSAASGPATQPEQVEVERKVADDVQHLAPGHPPAVRGLRLPAAARDGLSVQLGVGQRAGHRRPGRHRRRQGVPRPVARPAAAHRQEPVRHERSTRSRPSTCTTSAARARSASRTRSIRRSCSTRPSLFKEAGLERAAPRVGRDLQDAGRLRSCRGTGTPSRKIAKILTVDKNGKDATEAGFDPENIVQWGFEPQRDDLRQTGAYWKAGTLRRRRRQDRPDPRRLGRRLEVVLRRHLDRPHGGRLGRSSSNTDFNPNGYPFFTGKVAMSENYLWSTYGVKDAGDDWNMAATPSYQGQTTAAFNADTFRILKSTKHPDEAFTVLQYLLGNQELLKLYGGMPAVESQAGRLPPAPPGRLHADRSTGTSPRRASTTPTCRTSSRTCRPTTRPST